MPPPRPNREGVIKPTTPFFRLLVDEDGLTDALLAFVSDPRATRNDLPVIQDFIVGFKQGVATIDPTIEVQVSFIGNFNDAQKAYELTRNMLEGGADVVYNVAGPAGLGHLVLDPFLVVRAGPPRSEP